MFNFFGSLFHKTIVLFVGLVASIGMVSAPTSSISQIAIQQASSTTTSSETITTPPSSTPQNESANLPVAPSIPSPIVQEVKPKPAAASSPVIVSINPNITIQGFNNIVVVNGTGFQSGATTQVGGVLVQESGTVTPTALSFVLPASFNAGKYSITIINPDGKSFALANAISILQPQTPPAQSSPTQSPAAAPIQANAQAAEQAQATAALEQKTNQINALTSAYNTQYNALQQQILNIKSQYYTQEADGCGGGIDEQECEGEQTNLLNTANTQIAKVQLQEQQLYLTYTEQVNAIQ